MMERLKQYATGALVGLSITIVAFPILRLFVETSLLAKALIVLLLPGLLVATARFFDGSSDAVRYLVLAAIQILYWVILWTIWLRWRDRQQ
jgi:hypothetical protein